MRGQGHRGQLPVTCHGNDSARLIYEVSALHQFGTFMTGLWW